VTPAALAGPAAALSRRRVLQLAGVAAAAGVLPTGCGTPRYAPPPGEPLRVLTPRSWSVLMAATARIVGPRGATLMRHGDVVPARAADRILAANPALAGPMTQALLVLEWGVWPVVRKVRPFTGITPGAQDLVLRDLQRSPLSLKRDLFAAIRSLALLTFYGDPATQILTGYPGPNGGDGITIADGMARPEDLV
jgi:hypothetical protein